MFEGTTEPSDAEKEFLSNMFLILLVCVLLSKFLLEAYFEKIQPPIGHNTGLVIIIGMLCSMTLYFIARNRALDPDS